MNFFTLTSIAKSVLIALVPLLFVQTAFSQTCAITINANCNASFFTISGDFDDPAGSGNCPNELVVSDGTNSVTVPRAGSCSTGNDTYLFMGNPAPFDCATTGGITVTLGTGGSIQCLYPTPSGVSGTLAVPVELVNFSAQLDEDKVILKWMTQTESNNDYFTIEKSTDGINFEVIGEESGAGISFEAINYSFIDERPLPGINYYRLSQTDFDGTSEYFNVLSVKVESARDGKVKVFPNPTSNFVNLSIPNSIEKEEATINILDLNGRLLKSKEVILDQSSIELSLENIPTGIYTVTVQVGMQLFHEKLSIY